MLTHDPKFDVPLLEVALRLPEVAYVGAMGSRRTHDDRMQRLREAGLTDDELARLSSPIGLDLGARTPEETAVSIAAEIIARQWGGTGDRLATSGGASTRTRTSRAEGAEDLPSCGGCLDRPVTESWRWPPGSGGGPARSAGGPMPRPGLLTSSLALAVLAAGALTAPVQAAEERFTGPRRSRRPSPRGS